MKTFVLIALLALTSSACTKGDNPQQKTADKTTLPQQVERPKIILKLDDFPAISAKEIVTSKEVLDFLSEKKVRAGLGIIADRLRTNPTTKAFLQPYMAQKDATGKPLFELWHHGLYHKDFGGAPYDDQKNRFNTADELVMRELGVQMHSFGAPGNKSDAVTVQVIAENPNYKCLMFVSAKNPDYEGALTKLNNRVNMETGTGVPDYDYFVGNFNRAKGQSLPYMVFQSHPNLYNTPERMEAFKKIVEFLIDQNVDFVTPYDFAKQ